MESEVEMESVLLFYIKMKYVHCLATARED